MKMLPVVLIDILVYFQGYVGTLVANSLQKLFPSLFEIAFNAQNSPLLTNCTFDLEIKRLCLL